MYVGGYRKPLLYIYTHQEILTQTGVGKSNIKLILDQLRDMTWGMQAYIKLLLVTTTGFFTGNKGVLN